MASELWLGLIGAGIIVLVGNRYIKHRIKKEVKVYGEEQIKNPGDEGEGNRTEHNRTTEGIDNSIEGGESETLYEKPDVKRRGLPSDTFEPDKSNTLSNRKPEKRIEGDNEATEWDRVAISNIESIY